LVVQTVTSSIVYSSGSNLFGSALGDTQTFTGSLNVTGSSHAIFGNVGIGVTSPNTWGTNLVIYNNQVTVTGGGYDGAFADSIFFGGNSEGTTYRNKIANSLSSNAGNQKMKFSVASGPTTWVDALTLTGTGAATFSSSVTATIFDSTSNAFRFNGSNALSLVTLNSQNVVKVNAAGYWGVQLVGANDQGIVINNTGLVGIGTTSPSVKLHTYLADGTNDNRLLIQQGSNGYASGINLVANNNDGARYNYINSGPNNSISMWQIGGGGVENTMIMYTSGSERMRIASSGKVSISAPTTADAFTVQGANNYWTSILTSGTTTSQAYGLYVKAGTNVSDVSFLIQNTSGTDILRILGTGNVGIGTTPSYILQTKDAGITVQNTYFGTGQVRVGGGLDHGASTVFSVAPGVVTFDRPGVADGALTINSSGYVTLPSQPSFLAAGISGQQDYTSGQVLVFGTTKHNVSSGYNTSTGRFTAPVAGRYLFNVNVYSYDSYAVAIVITINGTQYVPSDTVPLIYKPAAGISVNLSTSIIFELAASDYVEVRSRSGYTSRVYMSHSHFAGQLLS